MKRWLLGLVALLCVLGTPAAQAQLQPAKAGSLLSGTAVTAAGPVNGARFISPSGWRQCVFQYLRTAGTVTIELQQRIKGASGAAEWTAVAGSSSGVADFKFSITAPLGEYRASYTNAVGATFNVIYECDKSIVL